MKAVLHTSYGPPDELKVGEISKPKPAKNEVLIKITYSSVTSTDCNVRNLTFVSKLFRLPARLFMFGFFKPKIKILGIDLAGEIEAVGPGVTDFKVGDAVFGSPGMKFGAHAEYICLPEDALLVSKPEGLSWEEAGCSFLAGCTALFFIRDLGQVKAGHKILINGASGAIGSFAVQLAKYYGAEVTGVCSGANVDMVKALGADKVIDYTRKELTESNELFDIVFDVVGKTSYAKCRKIMKDDSIFLVNIIEFKDIVSMMLSPKKHGKRIKGGIAPEKLEDLRFLKQLLETGKIKPMIDRIYSLDEAVEAFRYVEAGHKKGNVVLRIEQ